MSVLHANGSTANPNVAVRAHVTQHRGPAGVP